MKASGISRVRLVSGVTLCALLFSAFGCSPKADQASNNSTPQTMTAPQGGSAMSSPGATAGSGASAGSVSDPQNAMNNPNVPPEQREKIRQMMSSQGGQGGAPGGGAPPGPAPR